MICGFDFDLAMSRSYIRYSQIANVAIQMVQQFVHPTSVGILQLGRWLDGRIFMVVDPLAQGTTRMKLSNFTLVVFSLLAISAWPSYAGGLKAGSWRIDNYEGGSRLKIATSYNLCLSSGQTWTTAGPIVQNPVNSPVTTHGPLIPGTGGWVRNGNNVTIYGTIGEAIQGAAFTAIGRMSGENSISGQYVNFNVSSQDWPNGLSGLFKAYYLGQACPL